MANADQLEAALRAAPAVPARVLEPQLSPAVQAWARTEAKAAELSAAGPQYEKAVQGCEALAAARWEDLGLPAALRAEVKAAAEAADAPEGA